METVVPLVSITSCSQNGLKRASVPLRVVVCVGECTAVTWAIVTGRCTAVTNAHTGPYAYGFCHVPHLEYVVTLIAICRTAVATVRCTECAVCPMDPKETRESTMYTDSDDDVPALVAGKFVESNEDTREADPSAGAATTNDRDTRPPVPVLLLSGFLGAGKSTLVNYILQSKHGYRIAVVMNEIGDTADIEKAAMIAEPEALEAAPIADWVELENGCICCSAKDDLVLSLERLIQQRSKFDYIVIEGTGLMDPGAVAAALWTDREVQAGSICLDAIVTVVDAKNILSRLDDDQSAQRQIAYADILLLNKIDLVDEETRAEVAKRVGALSDADLMECERCVVDLAKILGTGLYQGSDDIVERGAAGGDDNVDCDGHSHAHHHASSIGTETLLLDGRFDTDRLKDVMDELLWSEVSDMVVLRVKGLLQDAGGGRVVLQGVSAVYDLQTVSGEWPGGPSKIVFIGSGLDRDVLRARLQGALL